MLAILFVFVTLLVILAILHFTNVFDLTTLFKKNEDPAVVTAPPKEDPAVVTAPSKEEPDTKEVVIIQKSPPKLGDACETQSDCHPGFVCRMKKCGLVNQRGGDGDPCERNEDCHSWLKCNEYLNVCKRESKHKKAAGFLELENTESVSDVTPNDVFLIRNIRGNCLFSTNDGRLGVQPNLPGNKPDAPMEDVINDRCDINDPIYHWTVESSNSDYIKLKNVVTNKCLKFGNRWKPELASCASGDSAMLWKHDRSNMQFTDENIAQYGSEDNFPFFNLKSQQTTDSHGNICLDLDPWLSGVPIPKIKANPCVRGWMPSMKWQFLKKIDS